MNMAATGLGIARSLKEHGVSVIGLAWQKGIYGNFTRYAKVLRCPDSLGDPAGLLDWMCDLGRKLPGRSVVFPTRDADVVFLDRYRRELSPWFIPVVPPAAAVEICLNKWKTYLAAQSAGVAAPKCWLVESREELDRLFDEMEYPCVIKPVAAWHWRGSRNWEVVGGRKAIDVRSKQELVSEYEVISSANPTVLVQEMIPGGDELLAITACCLDAESNCLASVQIRKLLQIPETFGTGCIVETADYPELMEPTLRLLKSISFSGIAEVEYKWDTAAREYKLIEINPRPWDQHRLGHAAGADLIYAAYCEYAGLPRQTGASGGGTWKWIAEDVFLYQLARLMWQRNPIWRKLLKQVRGQRIYSIWSASDPLPFLAHMAMHIIPNLVGGAAHRLLRFS
jgi:predicted ATP-grasp superfamily ATP-dependent carboligase